MNTSDYKTPNTGDIIGCTDGDIGIVQRCYRDDDRGTLMIEVMWSSGETYTDPWDAEDFQTENDMFHIVSRA
tara:strand:+ start:271 stop:486 length:216 start_codon:yes stop_codon:yes gene_type:complete